MVIQEPERQSSYLTLIGVKLGGSQIKEGLQLGGLSQPQTNFFTN